MAKEKEISLLLAAAAAEMIMKNKSVCFWFKIICHLFLMNLITVPIPIYMPMARGMYNYHSAQMMPAYGYGGLGSYHGQTSSIGGLGSYANVYKTLSQLFGGLSQH